MEMDPWVVSNVLQPNLQWTGFLDTSAIHIVTVENFLKRAQQFVGVFSSHLMLCLVFVKKCRHLYILFCQSLSQEHLCFLSKEYHFSASLSLHLLLGM